MTKSRQNSVKMNIQNSDWTQFLIHELLNVKNVKHTYDDNCSYLLLLFFCEKTFYKNSAMYKFCVKRFWALAQSNATWKAVKN